MCSVSGEKNWTTDVICKGKKTQRYREYRKQTKNRGHWRGAPSAFRANQNSQIKQSHFFQHNWEVLYLMEKAWRQRESIFLGEKSGCQKNTFKKFQNNTNQKSGVAASSDEGRAYLRDSGCERGYGRTSCQPHRRALNLRLETWEWGLWKYYECIKLLWKWNFKCMKMKI